METRKHIYYIDALRTLACIAVITIHVSANLLPTVDMQNHHFVYLAALNSLARFAVPLFFMICGAVQLNKPICFCRAKKRALGFLLLFFVFGVIEALPILISKNPIGEMSLLKSFVWKMTSNTSYRWFLLCMVSIQLLLPFIQALCQKPNYVKNALGIFALMGILPYTLSLLPKLSILEHFTQGFGFTSTLLQAIFFCLLGHALHAKQDVFLTNKTKYTWASLALWLISGLVLCSVSIVASRQKEVFYTAMVEYFSLPLILNTLALYMLGLLHFQKPNKALHFIAKQSLFIYLLHLPVLLYLFLLPMGNIVVYSLEMLALCFTLSLLISLPLQWLWNKNKLH